MADRPAASRPFARLDLGGSNVVGPTDRADLFAVDEQTMILLHGFIKKSRTTPPKEIDLAEKRFKEYISGKT